MKAQLPLIILLTSASDLTRLVDRKGQVFISLNMSLLVKRQSVSGQTRQGYLSPMKEQPYTHPA